MRVPSRWINSLRARMLLGSGGIALLAILAAGLMVYGALETSRRINQITAAQMRMELYATLSARISDYALIAVEASNSPAIDEDARIARLSSRREVVAQGFERLEVSLASYVEQARSEQESNRRATWSLGLARMEAQFNALTRAVEARDPGNNLRARLDGFATQFSPLLDSAIGEEQRERSAAFAAIERLRRWVMRVAGLVAIAAALAFVLFQAGMIAPLMRRIQATSQAASLIGGGRLQTRLDIDRRDELGLLFANVNRMAARLDRRHAQVTADRARLNEIVEDRTAALRDANEALERIDENRRRFFSDVSHELRTPLTVILSEAEIGMRAKTMEVEDFHASLDVIHSRARRLNRRVEDLLRIARSESGRIELAEAVFDIGTAARDAIDDVAGLSKRRGIAIDAVLDGVLLTVGDVDWTRQVIAGLLENAVRHSPEGGIIRVHAEQDEAHLRLIISDEGNGMGADDLSAVFKRFERGEASRKGAGFGVGLALAKWVMETQAGGINLYSPSRSALSVPAHGPGTDVVLTMPRLVEGEE